MVGFDACLLGDALSIPIGQSLSFSCTMSPHFDAVNSEGRDFLDVKT